MVQTKVYLYPNNLKATANLWLWGLREFVILAVSALLSIFSLMRLGLIWPAAGTLCFAFLTVRMEEMTVLDFIRCAARFFLTSQQYFNWR